MCDVVAFLNEFCLLPSWSLLLLNDDDSSNSNVLLAFGIMKEHDDDDDEEEQKNEDDMNKQEHNQREEILRSFANNHHEPYIVHSVHSHKSSQKQKKKKKVVRFHYDPNNKKDVLIAGTPENDTTTTTTITATDKEEEDQLNKNKWYQDYEYEELLKGSLLGTGHMILNGHYQGDDDLQHCIRGLEFKLPTKSLQMKRVRRTTARNAVLQEQARHKQPQQPQPQQQPQQPQQQQRKQYNKNATAEKIAIVYANASVSSRNLSMLFGAYDAKEAFRIYNGEQESLSVLICRRLLALHIDDCMMKNKKGMMMMNNKKKKKASSKQQQQRRNTTTKFIPRLPSLLATTAMKRTTPKCLYLENIGESLLSVLQDDIDNDSDLISFPMNITTNNTTTNETIHLKYNNHKKKNYKQ